MNIHIITRHIGDLQDIVEAHQSQQKAFDRCKELKEAIDLRGYRGFTFKVNTVELTT